MLKMMDFRAIELGDTEASSCELRVIRIQNHETTPLSIFSISASFLSKHFLIRSLALSLPRFFKKKAKLK
jgi:hypothetical protein